MSKQTKTFEIEIVDKNEDGGEIIINTSAVDRDRDRVFPTGARIADYLRNPVVQFGHNYRDPWATIGRTLSLDIAPDFIQSKFELRPAANENDPQHIVRLLWFGEWIRTASIGFMPDADFVEENEFGGVDFIEWDLLEWSLVPIPANQEALRLAVKSLGGNPAILQRFPVGVNRDHTLRMLSSPDEKSEIVPSADGKSFARFYVVALPVDADPEIVLATADEPADIDDPALDDVTGHASDDLSTETDDDDEPNNDEQSVDEPNNDDDETDTALVYALAQLAESLKSI